MGKIIIPNNMESYTQKAEVFVSLRQRCLVSKTPCLVYSRTYKSIWEDIGKGRDRKTRRLKEKYKDREKFLTYI